MSVQRGFALIAILALVALITAFLIASALNRTPVDISNEREDRSMSALRKAKAALIAYAANEQWQSYKNPPPPPPSNTGYFQPGALPCPDRDDDGDADCVGTGITLQSSIIGRLPFKTLGIDDLRDASGERLWYALSHDFRKLRCSGGTVPPNCTVINSDAQGQLTVVGIAPATQAVAVLFAPGEAFQSQIRDPTNVTAHNDPLNYLEGPPNLSDPVNYVFTSAPISGTFNDRVLVITKAELMDAVEPVVAANIERDVKPLLQDYFNKWGAYPFAVPFAAGGPPSAQSAYQGVSPNTFGLLPLTDTATMTWASAAVTQLVGNPFQTGTPTVTSASCSIISPPLQAVCVVNYCCSDFDRPVITLEVFLGGANTAFVDIPPGTADPITDITMVKHDGVTPVATNPYGQWSYTAPYLPPTRTFVARPAGGALTYIGRLQPAGPSGTNGGVTITVPLPPAAGANYLPIVSSNPGPGGVNPNPNGAWFIANEWYKDTFYAVSPGYAPGGVPIASPATCSPLPATPSCLKVNNLPAPLDDKRAILVFAGRALGGQTHPSPSGNPGDYLEGQNATPADLIFEHRAGSPTIINDRVVVVSP
jgi:type II secretory pathway pseudopilin PulG